MVCVCVGSAYQARQCCDEGECLLANQEIDKFQSKEDAQKALQDIENFLEMALPFINYDPETLQYEFGIILSPELKVRNLGGAWKQIFKSYDCVSVDKSFTALQVTLHHVAITEFS